MKLGRLPEVVCKEAAVVLEKVGWCQGELIKYTNVEQTDEPLKVEAYCLVGAIEKACGVEEDDWERYDEEYHSSLRLLHVRGLLA